MEAVVIKPILGVCNFLKFNRILGHSAYGSSGHGGGGYDFTPQHIHYHHEEPEEDNGKGHKDLALSDLFEIALTAIAFLSFGCFILEVIMCITNAVSLLLSNKDIPRCRA